MNDLLPAGYSYLISKYSLDVCELFTQSYMTSRTVKETVRDEAVQKVYFPLQRYTYDDSWQGQITFALKYEGVIRTEWMVELDYLKRYDRMRGEMRKVVDLPEKKANQFIMFVQQNGGRLSQRKREFFAELRDDEVARLEKIVLGS